MTRVAARLTSRACCGPTTAEEAAHVLWLLTSFDAFDLLYTGRGLSLDEVVEILTEPRSAASCAGPRRRRARRRATRSAPAPASAPRRR